METGKEHGRVLVRRSGRADDAIDVFIEEKIPFGEIEKDMVTVTAKDIEIPVVSLQHLKRLKKAAGRPQDLADIDTMEALERAEKEER
jgi:hypothetical protein